MSLALVMLRCPDAVTPERREVLGGEFSIGRGLDNDWVLTDPDRHLSKRHCQLAFRSGQWQLADLSANGTYVNGGSAPVGPAAPRPLRGGDRISFAGYELEVMIDEGGFDDRSFDPFAAPVPDVHPFGGGGLDPADGLMGGVLAHAGDAVRLPHDFDPLGDPLDGPIGTDGDDRFRGPTRSDHAAALDGAFRPPPPVAVAIPDDWDLDAPPDPPPLQPMAQSAAQPPLQPVAQLPPQPAARPAVAVAPDLSPAAAARDADLLAAFLRGAALDAAPSDPLRAMELAGAALRAAVSGIRRTLIARASIKDEFRIEQTMIRSVGNNPLKFSADDDDALAASLGIGRRNAMSGADALTEALCDIRLHELATVAAMQSAVRALLAQFDPATIEAGADRGGLGKLPGQRKVRAWDAFEALHAKVFRTLSDDFDSVFGKAFARAYEKAMADLSDRLDEA